MFPPYWWCLPPYHRSTPVLGQSAEIRSVLFSVPSTITCECQADFAASNARAATA